MAKFKKSSLKKLVATTCFLSLGITTFATPLAYGMTAKPNNTTDVSVDIYPVVQEINYISNEGFTLNGDVNVVVHGTQEKAALPTLERILKERNISYQINNSIDSNKANILLSSDKSHCNDCTTNENDVLSKKEGYILNASDNINTNGFIKIIGADKDGVYNGILTLDQILEQAIENKIAEVNIADYPEIGQRGFIEGFYGTPWSHEDRMSLMRDTSKYKMNTYIYAPKDDIYHREQWKELYPQEKAQELAELARVGTENNLNFCWTIHPGATLQFTDEDYNAIIAKFEQLYSLGVRQFGVLFDDTDDWSRGKLQAEWINRINNEFVKAKGDIEPMIVISARYNSAWGPNMNRYFKPFMETLDKDIEVMWTGHATMSNVSKDVFEWPKTATGVDKDMAVWWNYPVNDYCDQKMLMAPLHNLNPDLDNVTGFYSNPMNQAEASKVALYSIADYTWNTDSFEYMKSWERSIEELTPEVASEFKRFASNISYLSDDGGASGPFIYDESVYLAEKIDTLNNAIQNGTSIVQPANALLAEFEIMKNDCKNINEKLTNKNLAKEIEPFIGAYEALADSGIASMKALIAANEGNIGTWMLENKEAKQKLASMNNFTVDRIEGSGPETYVVHVGTKRLKPLVSDVIAKGEEFMSGHLSGNVSSKVISNIANLPEINVESNNGKFSINNIQNLEIKPNEYLGFALPKAMMADQIEFLTNNKELKLQYSLNSIEWTDANIQASKSIASEDIPVTFVRVINTSNDKITANIDKLEVSPIYKAELSISENIGTYQSYKIENAIDGDLETKYWSDKPSAPGHFIKVDLGSTIPLYDVKSYFAVSDRMRNSEYEISVDGSNWTSIGELNYVSENGKMVASANANGQMARYIRIKANGSNTENNSSFWVQLYEIEVNKTVSGGGSDYVELVTGAPSGNFSNLYDSDLSSAYTPEAINEGDSLIYKMSRTTNVKDLLFLQDAENICDAKVSVKDINGNWFEIGKLDKDFVSLAVNKQILEVKLEFDASKPVPKIYEIITQEGEITPPTGEKPNKVSNLVSKNITSNSIELEWTAPTNTAISEYIIYKNGKEFIRTSNSSIIIDNLKKNSVYSFKVVALSSDNKISSPTTLNARTSK